MMTTTPHPSRQNGFSLIEVLIAVLIFSLGLIGLAGLLVMSTQANQGAFLRTHVTFLGQNMADRMRANPIGVWEGAYNGSISPPATTTSPSTPVCDLANPCSPAQVASRDIAQWSDMLVQYLPADAQLAAAVTCTPATGSIVTSAHYALRPPYDGQCTMSITWTERSLAIGQAAADQTFAWVFQP